MEYSKDTAIMPKYTSFKEEKTKNCKHSKTVKLFFIITMLCTILVVVDIILIYSFASILQNML